jgi:non-heme chloroperoxidase
MNQGNSIESSLVTRRELLIGGTAVVAAVALPSALTGAVAKAKNSTFPISNQGEKHMTTITTKDGTQIYYKDWGTGQPIVFSHGWPLTADDWDAQMLFFGQHGYRVARARRGTAMRWTPMPTT